MATLVTPSAIAILFAICLSLLIYISRRSESSCKHLPPGPKKWPFIGNMLQMQTRHPHIQFHLWAQRYGPIFHLRIGSQNIIVLNTAAAANELLANRSRIYSSRSAPHVAHDIIGAGQRVVFLKYGNEWKTVRRTLQSVLGPEPSKRVQPSQDLESRVLLYDLIVHGDKSLIQHMCGPNGEVLEVHWFDLIRRFVQCRNSFRVVRRLTNEAFLSDNLRRNDNDVSLLVIGADDVTASIISKVYTILANFLRAAQPGSYLADTFPILRRLPDFLASWRVEARRMHLQELDLFGGLLDELKLDAKIGSEQNSFVGSYLRQRVEGGYDDAPGCGLTNDGWLKDTMLAYTAGSVLEAGSDTIFKTLRSFISLMLCHPQVLKTAREEIDRVVGVDRMPTFEDEPDLPYVVACIKETLRYRPAAAFGVPHSNDEDDTYNGYFIPKGSKVIGNIWAIHMDPVRFPDPTTFNPNRFMDEDKPRHRGGGRDGHSRDHYVFGWGRRFCQGSHVAEASLFITVSRILWGIDLQLPVNPETGAFDMSSLEDEHDGNGVVNGPTMFNVGFKPRSAKHEMLIRKSFEDVQANWKELGQTADKR